MITRIAAAICAISFAAPVSAQDVDMSFFITSVGLGDGANLGGLEGADAHCQSLAEAVGSEGKVWRAYLSTQIPGNAEFRRATELVLVRGTTQRAN